MTDEQENMVIENMNLVYLIAHRYKYDEDSVGYGMIGLIKGVKSFDKTKGFAQSTYLYKCILNEINMSFRKPSKHKPPSQIVSLDRCVDNEENITYIDTIADKTVNIEEDLIFDETKNKLKKAINQLTPKERYLISSYYGLYGYEQKKQIDIALDLNVKQATVSRLHGKILNKLKRIMESD